MVWLDGGQLRGLGLGLDGGQLRGAACGCYA
jgi:hypothetical protein